MHHVFYYSKRTTETEAKYHSYELVFLELVYAVKRFHVYLNGTVESAYCGHRLIWASAYCGQTELVPIQMYINNVKSNRIIWALDSVYVGNFILS